MPPQGKISVGGIEVSRGGERRASNSGDYMEDGAPDNEDVSDMHSEPYHRQHFDAMAQAVPPGAFYPSAYLYRMS